jgi:hypothetical protein
VDGSGGGLRTVAETAAQFDGRLSVEPSGLTGGKQATVRLRWRAAAGEGPTAP